MAVKRTIIISAETKAAQKSVDELTEQLEIQDKVIQKLTDDQAFYEEKLASASKSNLAAQKFYNDKLRETNLELTKEQKARRVLTQEQKAANKTLKETVKEQDKLTGVVGLADKATGGAITSMQGFYKSILTAVKGMNLLKIAIIGTGIGALLIAVTSLIAAFKRSEAGQETLQIAMAAIGAIVNQVMDVFASLGDIIISAFKNPLESIKKFKDFIVQNITNRFNAAIDTIGFLGSAIKKVFSGDFSGAMDDAKKAGSSYVDTLTGIQDTLAKTSKSIIDYVNETKTEVSAIIEITKARQKAHHIDRALKTERAEADRKINDIRLQAEDREKNNATQRIALLKEAQRLEEEITQKEILSQRIKIKAQADEMALGKTTIEDKDKLAEMQAKLIQLDTKKLRSQRLLQTQITTAKNEEIAERDRQIKEFTDKYVFIPGMGFVTKESIEKMKADGEAVEEILKGFEEQKRQEEAITEEQKLLLKQEKSLTELDGLNATEEQKEKIIAFYSKKIQKAKDADIKADAARDKIEKDAKLAMAKSTFLGIAQLLGQNSKAGKAAAAAAALINTYQGITAELATKTVTPFEIGLKIANVATIAGIGFKSVKDILKTNPKSTSGATAANPTRTASAATPNVSSIMAQTPSFNILGTSGTNQIASALGEQPPVQAFVVSQDVTTAQSLQNNIIQSASLG